MSKVTDACLDQMPSSARAAVYLAVGSTNEHMVAIADRKYTLLGGMIMHAYNPTEVATATVAATAMTARKLDSSDIGVAWALFTSQPAYQSGERLLLPGRFYGFRAPRIDALAEKIESGRAVGIFGSSAEVPLLALVLEFDTGMEHEEDGKPIVLEVHTALFATHLDTAATAAALFAFGRSRPTVTPSGVSIRLLLSNGPFMPPSAQESGAIDVDADLKTALALAGYTRRLASHLRVYRMPPGAARIGASRQEGAEMNVGAWRHATSTSGIVASAIAIVAIMGVLALHRLNVSSTRGA